VELRLLENNKSLTAKKLSFTAGELYRQIKPHIDVSVLTAFPATYHNVARNVILFPLHFYSWTSDDWWGRNWGYVVTPLDESRFSNYISCLVVIRRSFRVLACSWNEYKGNAAMGIIFYVMKGRYFLFSIAVFMAGLVVFVRNISQRKFWEIWDVALHLSLLNSPDMNDILFYMPCQLRNIVEHQFNVSSFNNRRECLELRKRNFDETLEICITKNLINFTSNWRSRSIKEVTCIMEVMGSNLGEVSVTLTSIICGYFSSSRLRDSNSGKPRLLRSE
jgi:hypothetical protein